VKACKLITRPVISKRQTLMAEHLFLKFAGDYAALYGRGKVTPNMHFACHLSECVLAFGPVYSFWSFAFERYNGQLGRYQGNGRDSGKMYMRKMSLEEEIAKKRYRIGDERIGINENELRKRLRRKSRPTARHRISAFCNCQWRLPFPLASARATGVTFRAPNSRKMQNGGH